MDEMVQLQNSRKNREKSVRYPAISIDECIDFIRQVDELGGKSISYASILSMMNLKSPATRSFQARISAAKQFGFLQTGKGTAQLTDTARRILYPNEGQEESERLKIEAFGKPPLYEKLIERFKDKALPETTQLGNILMNEYHIIKQVKDVAAGCFIESANSLGLLATGVLHIGQDENKNEQATSSDEDKHLEAEEKTSRIPSETAKTIEREDGYLFEVPTLGKKNAKFYIPDGVTEKDIDYIKMYVEHMLPVFLDNLKEEL